MSNWRGEPRNTRQSGLLAVVPVLTILLFANEAHAYIDPGTGSLIIQMIAGAFLASLMTVKLWWYRMTGFFTKVFRPEDKEGE